MNSFYSHDALKQVLPHPSHQQDNRGTESKSGKLCKVVEAEPALDPRRFDSKYAFFATMDFGLFRGSSCQIPVKGTLRH
jgi:hypothetical protein